MVGFVEVGFVLAVVAVLMCSVLVLLLLFVNVLWIMSLVVGKLTWIMLFGALVSG